MTTNKDNPDKYHELTFEEYEGKCVGYVNGKIVVASDNFEGLIKELDEKYPNEHITIGSVPKRGTIQLGGAWKFRCLCPKRDK